VATYYPEARALLAQEAPGSQAFPRQALSDADVRRMQVPLDSWNDVSGSAACAECRASAASLHCVSRAMAIWRGSIVSCPSRFREC